MASAHRKRKSRALVSETDSILICGTYSLEEKVTVEWERAIGVAELQEQLQRLPNRVYSQGELRNFFSGYLKERDNDLPNTKISHYKLSNASIKRILRTLEAEEKISCEVTKNGALGWAPKN